MTENNIRNELIVSFNDIRPSFLAALDQIIVEMRPKMDHPGFYQGSVLACAQAFADSSMVRDQLTGIEPGIVDRVSDDELVDAHLASIAYLFSLTLHELINNPKRDVS